MKTPIGTVKAVFTFSEQNGAVVGTADGGHGDIVEMRDVTMHDGDRVTWAQTVNRPMRLNLEFDVRVDGDELRGTSRAGRLPSSAVTATRRESSFPNEG